MTGPCGNGFDTAALAGQYKRLAVVGGGIGTAPLLLLCKELCRAGVRPDLFVGFRDTTYGMDRFVPWCRDIYAATDSGKEGHHGLVTDLLDVSKYDIVLTCGPMVMMRGVAKLCATAGVPAWPALKRRWPAVWARAWAAPAIRKSARSPSARTARSLTHRRCLTDGRPAC